MTVTRCCWQYCVDRIKDRVIQVAAGSAPRLDEHRAQVQFFDASAQFGHGIVHLVAWIDAGDADEAPGARTLHFREQVVGRRALGKVEASEPRSRIATGNGNGRRNPCAVELREKGLVRAFAQRRYAFHFSGQGHPVDKVVGGTTDGQAARQSMIMYTHSRKYCACYCKLAVRCRRPPIRFSPHDPRPTLEIIAELKAGRMVVLVDEEDRENEGDVVVAADFVTPEAINFMARHARG
jgi:hypothetical protein